MANEVVLAPILFEGSIVLGIHCMDEKDEWFAQAKQLWRHYASKLNRGTGIPTIELATINEPNKTRISKYVTGVWKEQYASLPTNFQNAFNEWCRPDTTKSFFCGELATSRIAGNDMCVIAMGPRKEARIRAAHLGMTFRLIMGKADICTRADLKYLVKKSEVIVAPAPSQDAHSQGSPVHQQQQPWNETTRDDVRSVHAAMARLTGQSSASTFTVTPGLAIPQSRFEKAHLRDAMKSRWNSKAWRRKALKLHCDSNIGGKLLHVERDGMKVCFPHQPGENSLESNEHCSDDDDSSLESEAHCSHDDDPDAHGYGHECRHGFIQCIIQAWNNHYPLILKPEQIWLLILQAVGRHVKEHPEQLRGRVLSRKSAQQYVQTGKLELIVRDRDDDGRCRGRCDRTEINGDKLERLCKTFDDQAAKHLTLMMRSASKFEFSTTSQTEIMAQTISVLDTCKSYFNYWFVGRCGFPMVTLAGSLDDWDALRSRAEEVIEALCLPDFAHKWLDALLPTLDQFVKSYTGEVDERFWNAMIKEGGTFHYNPADGYTGWFNVFFPGNGDVSGHGSKFGFNRFCRAFGQPFSDDEYMDLQDDEARQCKWFPSGIAQVPVQCANIFDTNSDLECLEFHGGFVGYTQDEHTGAMTPVVSWYAVKKDEVDAALPCGWKSARDDDTGHEYYYNETLAINKQWEHPCSYFPAADVVPISPPAREGPYPFYWSEFGWNSEDEFLRLSPITQDGDAPTWNSLAACLKASQPDWLGQGKDYPAFARREPYNNLELAAAWRVENSAVWRKYCVELDKMRDNVLKSGLTLPDVRSFGGPVPLAAQDLPGKIRGDVGELFLLHGTDKDNICTIINEGLNERFSRRPYFGHGCYCADDAGKVDQYVGSADRKYDIHSELHRILYYDTDLWHPKDVYYAVLCRVALGCPAHSYDGRVTLDGGDVWARPRWDRGQARELAMNTDPRARSAIRYHSLIVEPGGPKGKRGVLRYREFILPHSDRIYPEYIVAFRRSWCEEQA